MLKKILIGVGVLIVLVVVAFFYMNNRNRTMSPPGSASLENDGISVSVNYSRPSARDRLIFGEVEEGALQPYGIYWRLGANEPTVMDVSADFLFGGKEFQAGKYVIYAIPRKGEMEVRLSSDLRLWGYTEPNYEMDLASEVVRVNINSKVEQFTIDAEKMEGGVNMVFTWDVYKWSLPVLKK